MRSGALIGGVLSLALFAGPSCAEESEGIVVEVVVEPAAGVSGATSIALEGGAEGLVTEAIVAIEYVELVPCADGAEDVARAVAPAVMRDALHEIGRALLGPGHARAHGATTSLRLGVPAAFDALGDPAPLSLGALRPTPGRYCAVHAVVAPPDGDAETNLAASFAGAARVAWSGSGDAADQGAIETSMTAAFDIPLPLPLTFDADRRGGELALSLDLEALLGALEPVTITEASAEAQAALSAAAVTSLRASLRPW